MLHVPTVTGLPVSQATAMLQTLGFRITESQEMTMTAPTGTVLTQDPAPGTVVPEDAVVTLVIESGITPQQTFTLAPTRLVTVSAFAVAIMIPPDWQLTPGLRSAVGYNGISGWVQVQAVTEPANLQAACSGVAAQNVSQYGRHPFISDRSIDGRPGCQIVPNLPTGGNPVLPRIAALVEYRSPLRDGANFLLISADPATLLGIIASVKVNH
jgi:hypothetical protein